MNANDIQIGTKLEIEVPEYNKNEDYGVSSYISQLLDFVDDKTISVAAPMSEGRFKYLSKGSNVLLYFLNGRQELLFFKGVILNYRKNDPLDAFDISIEGEATKIQRRRFYRLAATLDCQYKVLEEAPVVADNYKFPNIDKSAFKTCYTKNISGSGFCLILDEALETGTVIDIAIDLESKTPLRVLAQAIRSINTGRKKYEVGMHYIKITSRDSDTLTKFIFEKQRLMLKNSKLAKQK